jgi:hypothetical protein
LPWSDPTLTRLSMSQIESLTAVTPDIEGFS